MPKTSHNTQTKVSSTASIIQTADYNTLYSEVCNIIDNARQQLAAAYTNYQLLMYWSIGTRINQDVLGGKRAEYGKKIVSTLSAQLQQ